MGRAEDLEMGRGQAGRGESRKKQEIGKLALAMTDVDRDYFARLAGRMVKEKLSVYRYTRDIGQIFRARLLADEACDEHIRMERQFAEERKRLEGTRRRYRQHVDAFERFLSRDHEASMLLMEETSERAAVSQHLAGRKDGLSKEFGQVRLDVLGWEESWRMAKMCQKFLYQISPLSWRLDNDWICRSGSEESVLSSDSLVVRFDRFDAPGAPGAPDKLPSLESLIGLFERDIGQAGPAGMYFDDPMDLVRVFRAMETQNLNAMIHLESLAGSMTDAMATILTVQSQITSEVQEIHQAIADLEESIRQTEERSMLLEEYADNLLEGVFRQLVCSRPVLQLRVFLEDTYESCIAPNDANLESFSMMRSIEKTYERINLQLDRLPRELVQRCEREGFMEEAKAMKDAESAAKKFELMHRLLESLKRVMQPVERSGRRSVYRSAPMRRGKSAKPPPAYPTHQQMLYINFFTDSCPTNDPTQFHQLPQISDNLSSCLAATSNE